MRDGSSNSVRRPGRSGSRCTPHTRGLIRAVRSKRNPGASEHPADPYTKRLMDDVPKLHRDPERRPGRDAAPASEHRPGYGNTPPAHLPKSAHGAWERDERG